MENTEAAAAGNIVGFESSAAESADTETAREADEDLTAESALLDIDAAVSEVAVPSSDLLEIGQHCQEDASVAAMSSLLLQSSLNDTVVEEKQGLKRKSKTKTTRKYSSRRKSYSKRHHKKENLKFEVTFVPVGLRPILSKSTRHTTGVSPLRHRSRQSHRKSKHVTFSEDHEVFDITPLSDKPFGMIRVPHTSSNDADGTVEETTIWIANGEESCQDLNFVGDIQPKTDANAAETVLTAKADFEVSAPIDSELTEAKAASVGEQSKPKVVLRRSARIKAMVLKRRSLLEYEIQKIRNFSGPDFPARRVSEGVERQAPKAPVKRRSEKRRSCSLAVCPLIFDFADESCHENVGNASEEKTPSATNTDLRRSLDEPHSASFRDLEKTSENENPTMPNEVAGVLESLPCSSSLARVKTWMVCRCSSPDVDRSSPAQDADRGDGNLTDGSGRPLPVSFVGEHSEAVGDSSRMRRRSSNKFGAAASSASCSGGCSTRRTLDALVAPSGTAT